MKKTSYQYKWEDAEILKQTYSSWIGKPAHVGKGESDILTKITIKARKKITLFENAEVNYHVQFVFTKYKLNAPDFLKNNGLKLI